MPRVNVDEELFTNIKNIIEEKEYPQEIYDEILVIIQVLRHDGQISPSDLYAIVNRIGNKIIENKGAD